MSEAKKCRVLFVEDEAAISILIEDMLLDLGIEVVGPASSLATALELARKSDLEAAVLDINVGGSLSFPVADALRERGILVIFVTGYGLSVLPERFRRNRILHKPFTEQDFADALRSALAESPCDIETA